MQGFGFEGYTPCLFLAIFVLQVTVQVKFSLLPPSCKAGIRGMWVGRTFREGLGQTNPLPMNYTASSPCWSQNTFPLNWKPCLISLLSLE